MKNAAFGNLRGKCYICTMQHSEGNNMTKKGNLTRKELRNILPQRLNKLGEWYFSDDPGKLQIDFTGMTDAQMQRFWRLALK